MSCSVMKYYDEWDSLVYSCALAKQVVSQICINELNICVRIKNEHLHSKTKNTFSNSSNESRPLCCICLLSSYSSIIWRTFQPGNLNPQPSRASFSSDRSIYPSPFLSICNTHKKVCTNNIFNIYRKHYDELQYYSAIKQMKDSISATTNYKPLKSIYYCSVPLGNLLAGIMHFT